MPRFENKILLLLNYIIITLIFSRAIDQCFSLMYNGRIPIIKINNQSIEVFVNINQVKIDKCKPVMFSRANPLKILAEIDSFWNPP